MEPWSDFSTESDGESTDDQQKSPKNASLIWGLCKVAQRAMEIFSSYYVESVKSPETETSPAAASAVISLKEAVRRFEEDRVVKIAPRLSEQLVDDGWVEIISLPILPEQCDI